MKKVVISLVMVTVVVITAFIFIDVESPEVNIKVTSQQDTNVDESSTKDTFEYFLSGLGEANLPDIKKHFEQFTQEQNRTREANLELFSRYIKYREALQNLDVQNLRKLDLASLKQLDRQLLDLQEQFFTLEERKVLFSEEAQYRHIALRQLELQQLAQGEQDYNNLWQQEVDSLPEDLQRSYKNAALLGQLQESNALEGQDRYLQQQQLVGSEAANRLEALQLKRAEFQENFDHYSSQRKKILEDNSLDFEARIQAIKGLRNEMFSPNQQRRVIALESMYDQSQ